MVKSVETEFLNVFTNAFEPPFIGSIAEWANKNVELPASYAIPGKVDLSISPYLIQPLLDIRNPKIRMVNKFAAVQTAKSLGDELSIPFWITQDPGPVMRVHATDEIASNFTETRLVPLLRNCKPVKHYLNLHRNTTKKRGITLPHMSVSVTGAKESFAHGFSIRYLILDDAWLFDADLLEKFVARTNAFAGRRKIIISSQPNRSGSVLEKYYKLGKIFQWQWCCPQCKKCQPYYWSKERDDGSFAGFNCDHVLNDDGTRNIALSARTCWLECFHCKHQVHDNYANRRMLNDTGTYICIKSDGDPEVHSYTWPAFVNINLSYEYFAIQYFNAKRIQKMTGLSDDVVTFKNQVLGEFHYNEPEKDLSKMLIEAYESTDIWEKEGLKILTSDIMRSGLTKYYVVRSWSKDGKESRQLERNIVRNWEQVKEVQKKWKILPICVGIDAGDNRGGALKSDDQATTVYGECVKNGEIWHDAKGRPVRFSSWTALKGDGEASFKHPDGSHKLYSQPFKGDPALPTEHRLKGFYANGFRWASTPIKSILLRLRDQLVPGVKWVTNSMDKDYENQMWSEGWTSILNPRTGLAETKWMVHSDVNHWLDVEAMNLCMAIMLGGFTLLDFPDEPVKQQS